MVSTINRVHSFVKGFRAYLAKGPFKVGKNYKVLRVLKDDSRKTRSKKLHQISSIKDKKQIIEEAFGVECGMNVKAIYATNLQKQRIHSKIYLGNTSYTFPLRNSSNQAIPEGVATLAYSYKSYENENLANNIEIKECVTPETNKMFHCRSIFSRNYTDEPVDSTNAKDANSPGESHTSCLMNYSQLCPYCQCRMKYIEERRKYEMGSSYPPISTQNYQYYSGTIRNESKTSCAENNSSVVQSKKLQDQHSEISEVQSLLNYRSSVSTSSQEKQINSPDETPVICPGEQTSFTSDDKTLDTSKNIKENEYIKPEIKKIFNFRSLFSMKRETQEQTESTDETSMISRKENQKSFKRNEHMLDSCNPILPKNIEEKLSDQSEKQTAFQNPTIMIETETKQMRKNTEKSGVIYQQENQMSSKINNHVPDVCHSVPKNREKTENYDSEWKKSFNIRSLFSITSQEKRINSINETGTSPRKDSQMSSKLNDHISTTCQQIPKNVEEEKQDKIENNESFNIRPLISTKGETQKNQMDFADKAGLVSRTECQRSYKIHDHISDCCQPILSKNFEQTMPKQPESQTSFRNRFVLTHPETKPLNSEEEANMVNQKESETNSKTIDCVPDTFKPTPKNIEETEYEKSELKKPINIQSLLSTKEETQEERIHSTDKVGMISRKDSRKSFNLHDHISDSCKSKLPKNIEDKVPDRSHKQTAFQIERTLTETGKKHMEATNKTEGESNMEATGNISGRSDKKNVDATPTLGSFLKTEYKNDTMSDLDADNDTSKHTYDNLDLACKNTTEKSSSLSDKGKTNVSRIPDNIGATPVLEPFLSLTNQSDSKLGNDNSEPHIRVRTYYKTVPNQLEPHPDPQRDNLKDNNETDIKHQSIKTCKENSTLTTPKQYYKYRVTLEKIPATSVKGDETFIMPPPPLPPIIPTDTTARSSPMDVESVNTERTDITVESKMGDTSKLILAKTIEKAKIDEVDEIKEKPIHIHRDQFGYGDPYFHIRSYYRPNPHLKDDFKYPIQASTFVPNHRPPSTPEPDPLPPTPPKPKKRTPCDRLKKGYYDPPKRLYSTYSFQGKYNNAVTSKGRHIKAVTSNVQSNIRKDLSRRATSKKSNTNLKSLSALRIYNIGRF